MKKNTSRRKERFFIAEGYVEYEKDGKPFRQLAQVKLPASQIVLFCEKSKKTYQDLIPEMIKQYYIDTVKPDNSILELREFLGKFVY